MSIDSQTQHSNFSHSSSGTHGGTSPSDVFTLLQHRLPFLRLLRWTILAAECSMYQARAIQKWYMSVSMSTLETDRVPVFTSTALSLSHFLPELYVK
ncbi:hypothetical protein VKT23_014391 [Stygiomarasmius scandens]|uniref:Uncharacterized protein n=1 Tax=Marasmiellus scandens TaxID=2682957 RepID=A0ABR1J407_9AGAR